MTNADVAATIPIKVTFNALVLPAGALLLKKKFWVNLFLQTVLNGTTFTSTNTLQLPYRSFGINFTYKFGRMEFKKQKEAEDVNLTNPIAPGN